MCVQTNYCNLNAIDLCGVIRNVYTVVFGQCGIIQIDQKNLSSKIIHKESVTTLSRVLLTKPDQAVAVQVSSITFIKTHFLSK